MVRNTLEKRGESRRALSGKALHVHLVVYIDNSRSKYDLPYPLRSSAREPSRRAGRAGPVSRPDVDSPGAGAHHPPRLAERGGVLALPKSSISAVGRRSRSEWTSELRGGGKNTGLPAGVAMVGGDYVHTWRQVAYRGSTQRKTLGCIEPPFVAVRPGTRHYSRTDATPAKNTPLTVWDHMLASSFFSTGLARMKHTSTATENASWFGAAATAPWTFSRGVHPQVPVLVVLISPRPMVFVTRTRVLWLGVRLRVSFDRLAGCGGQRKVAHHAVGCTLEG